MTPLQTWLATLGMIAVLLAVVFVGGLVVDWFERQWLKAHSLDDVRRHDEAREAMRRWHEG